MSNKVTAWRLINVSEGGAPIPLLSMSHAIELLLETSKKKIGETLELVHSDRGLICCTAANGHSTLSFHPGYDEKAHSLVGNRSALSDNRRVKFYFVDSNKSVSSIPSMYVLPILDVVRGLIYILENHSFPEFLKWNEPAPE